MAERNENVVEVQSSFAYLKNDAIASKDKDKNSKQLESRSVLFKSNLLFESMFSRKNMKVFWNLLSPM